MQIYTTATIVEPATIASPGVWSRKRCLLKWWQSGVASSQRGIGDGIDGKFSVVAVRGSSGLVEEFSSAASQRNHKINLLFPIQSLCETFILLTFKTWFPVPFNSIVCSFCFQFYIVSRLFSSPSPGLRRRRQHKQSWRCFLAPVTSYDQSILCLFCQCSSVAVCYYNCQTTARNDCLCYAFHALAATAIVAVIVFILLWWQLVRRSWLISPVPAKLLSAVFSYEYSTKFA